ncbi:MAG: hypothetical protein JO250_11065 [Armatimonadetes bacterium]|nr:hypothetical protein [Armatimonadota bacterium]
MIRCLIPLTLSALVALAAPAARAQTPSPVPVPAAHLYPLGRALPSPDVKVDVSDAPEARAWAEQARVLVIQWFPLVCQFLATDRFTPPKTITLAFKKDLPVPAYTTGTGTDGATISISGKWITAHPDDFGMVIHEMTHVIQGYPGRGDKPGWLVEGIADYIRFYRYEPDVPRRNVDPRDPQKASYRDAYRTTASFLAYVTWRYNRGLLSRLDAALRAGTYSDGLWKTITGKDLDALWTEFIGTLPAAAHVP